MSEKYERAALQNPEELRLFCKLVHEQNAKSYLEIGSKHGGSLWRIASAMPKGSKIVSVDSPNADGSFKNSMPNLISCVNHLNRDGYKAHLIIGDSTDPETIIKVKDLAPFDVLLIDANHSREFVQSDWNNYGSLAKMIAFHDICNPRAQVKDVFEEVCKLHKSRIIFDSRTRANQEDWMGLGIIWR